MSEIENIRKLAEDADAQFVNVQSQIAEVARSLEAKRAVLTEKFKAVLSMDQASQIDLEALPQFLEEPYVLVPKAGQEWYVVVPRWLKFQVGYLDHQTPSFNVFIVNKYVKWLSEIPLRWRQRYVLLIQCRLRFLGVG